MTRVLIVDDSLTIRKIVSDIVTKIGGSVVATAADGDEGVNLFKTHSPDLVILDITMPNKDGRECLQEILAINPRSVVVMLSAINSPELIKECLALGAKSFLSKTTGLTDGSLATDLRRFVVNSQAA